ncbi:M20/M25/M40 family metallo-hydrolase [Tamlana fucoidanivorans]|uniref:M20/M25/M40 family metallo-hydrolase n=1 Tax=Allotamlana fucoidanivorans TaxID=2583814 RepID=A0A5C4SJ70_9FLAO|nr:M20/M25/M40 family metallo-hydrolase [Tamlana fucoidanivorans]TNJ43808.1 M20/M25/M40 family metallo-hydrolase [Tamlana fucoidanivorans]
MKKVLAVACLCMVLSCGGQKKSLVSSSGPIEKNISDSVHVELTKKEIKYAELADVKFSLEYLASDELQGRNTGSEGIEKAAVFIETLFKKNDIKPFFKTYRDSFHVKSVVGYNVVGYIEGSDSNLKKEFVILGAHYDHIGFGKQVEGDSIANGANDDASGTVAVLEWAKYFAKSKTNKRSILFTLYSAEELGLKGSEHLASRLKSDSLNLYTMINFEMIGVPRSKDKTLTYITGYDLSNMADKLNHYAGEELVGFLPEAKQYSLFKRSDNYPFYQAFHVPAQAISTFDFTNFEYYHHVYDEPDKMDFNHMTSFINKMIPAIEGIVNSDVKEIKMNGNE